MIGREPDHYFSERPYENAGKRPTQAGLPGAIFSSIAAIIA